MEFADKLLEYENNRKELVSKIQNIYSNIGMKFPKLESKGIPEDIDPFTVFGLFNKKISDPNRIMLLKGISNEFEISAEVPTDFSGIPVLNNMMATFYAFTGDDHRKEGDIDNLWITFERALQLATNDTEENRNNFSLAFNKVRSQFAVKWNLTMALYWVRPYVFVNLDSCNREFLGNPEHAPANVVSEIKSLKTLPTAEEYLEICDNCRSAFESGQFGYKSFPELSYNAWEISAGK